MVLQVAPTLAELRNAVAIRMNMGVQASTSTALHPVLDEYIRQAFNLLVREANWVILEVVEEITLIDKQHKYDIPDNMAVGNINQITVQNIYNQEFPLASGVAYYERNAWRIDRGGDDQDNPGSIPMRWTVEDGDLVIYPAPDTTQYTKLLIRGEATPREPYKDDDRAYIDKEAHITQAVIALKTHYKMDPTSDMQVLARHLRNIRSEQSDGETVQIGPTRSQRYPSADERLDTNDRAAFWPDFDPFANPYGRFW